MERTSGVTACSPSRSGNYAPRLFKCHCEVFWTFISHERGWDMFIFVAGYGYDTPKAWFMLRIRHENMADHARIWLLARCEQLVDLDLGGECNIAISLRANAEYLTVLKKFENWEISGMLQPFVKRSFDFFNCFQLFLFLHFLPSCRRSVICKIYFRKIWILFFLWSPENIFIYEYPSSWTVAP